MHRTSGKLCFPNGPKPHSRQFALQDVEMDDLGRASAIERVCVKLDHAVEAYDNHDGRPDASMNH